MGIFLDLSDEHIPSVLIYLIVDRHKRTRPLFSFNKETLLQADCGVVENRLEHSAILLGLALWCSRDS